MAMLDDQTRRSWAVLGRWLVVSVLAGSAAACAVWGFDWGLGRLTPIVWKLLGQYLWAGPAIGGLVLWLLFYTIEPEASGDGMPSYIVSMNHFKGQFRFRTTVLKYLATIVALSFGGSGGVVGPLVRVCGGVGSVIGRVLVGLGARRRIMRQAAMCGAAGALSAILRSPIGAGIFAVEVLHPTAMNYSELFPSILASATAFAVCLWLPPFALIPSSSASPEPITLSLVPWTLGIGVLCGLLALCHIALFEWLERERTRFRLWLRVTVGGIVLSLLALGVTAAIGKPSLSVLDENVFGTVLGTGRACFEKVVAGPIHMPEGAAVYVIMLAVLVVMRMLASAITISSGMSAGLTEPSIVIGALAGSAVAAMVPGGERHYHALVAVGVAGMLAANVNVPVAAAVIVVEKFGFMASFPAIVGSFVAFQIARTKTIYDMATRDRHRHEEGGTRAPRPPVQASGPSPEANRRNEAGEPAPPPEGEGKDGQPPEQEQGDD